MTITLKPGEGAFATKSPLTPIIPDDNKFELDGDYVSFTCMYMGMHVPASSVSIRLKSGKTCLISNYNSLCQE